MAHACTIKRLRQGYNGGARTTEAWDVIATNVPCRVRSRTQQSRESTGDQTAETWTTWWVHVPQEYRLMKDDRIEVEGAQTFNVVDPATPEPTFRVETIVQVELALHAGRAMP